MATKPINLMMVVAQKKEERSRRSQVSVTHPHFGDDPPHALCIVVLEQAGQGCDDADPLYLLTRAVTHTNTLTSAYCYTLQ